MPSRARASSTRTPAVRKVRFCWYASSISRVSVGSLNTVHQSRCSEAVELTALFPCSSHLSATVVGGVLKSGPSMHPWTKHTSAMINGNRRHRTLKLSALPLFGLHRRRLFIIFKLSSLCFYACRHLTRVYPHPRRRAFLDRPAALYR